MTTTSSDHKIVTFSLAGRMFGIDMASLIEIREWEEPTPLPRVPDYIRGVANLRGTVIPIVGLAERLGWCPSTVHARSCVLVVGLGGKQAGFLVDEVNDIVAIDGSAIQPAPEVQIAEAGVVAGLVAANLRGDQGERTSMVTLLDLDALGITGQLEAAA